MNDNEKMFYEKIGKLIKDNMIRNYEIMDIEEKLEMLDIIYYIMIKVK